jgi:hypothetical protein
MFSTSIFILRISTEIKEHPFLLSQEPRRRLVRFYFEGGASKTLSSSQQQQQAALNRLLAKYKAALARGESGGDLPSLGKQIAAAAKALGQHVSLPKASAGVTDSESTAGSLAQSPGDQPTEASKSKVNLTA